MRRMLTLSLVWLGLVLAAVGFELGSAWPYHSGAVLGWAGIVLSAVAAYLQYRDATPFEYPFTEASWEPLGPEEVCLEIAPSEHGKGRGASVRVYNGAGEEVHPDITVDPAAGWVLIAAREHARLSGRVVIT